MAERPSDRPHIELSRWASVDQTEVADPGSGLKDDGYQDSDIPANEEHNGLFHPYYLRYLNLQGSVRIFDTLAQALDLIGAVAPSSPIAIGDTVRVFGFAPETGNALGTTMTSMESATLVAAIIDLATDGQRVFSALSSAGSTANAQPALGGTAGGWSVALPDTPNLPTAIEADGLSVYVATATGNNVYILNPVTGALVGTIATLADAITDVAANGEDLCVALAGGTDAVRVYNTLGAAPTFVGQSASHGADVNAVCLDHNRLYLAGDISSTFQVRSHNLDGGITLNWSTALLGAGAANDIKCDGSFVYVATDLGSTQSSVFCLRKTDGVLVWEAAGGGLDDAKRIAIDDRFVWASVGTETTVFDKTSGQIVSFDAAIAFTVMACDGYLCIGSNGASDYHARLKGAISTDLVVSETDDPFRRPFPRLAIPTRETPQVAPSIPAHAVFGEDFQSTVNTVADADSTGTFQEYLTLNTPVLEAGTYRVGWRYVWNHDSTANDGIFRVQLDNVTDLIDPANGGVHQEELTDAGADQRITSSGFEWVVLGAGAHFIDIDFTTSSGGSVTNMYNARLEIWRVA